MIVYCPECMARYELPDERKGIKFRCKKCSGVVYTDEMRRVECPNPFDTGAHPAVEAPSRQPVEPVAMRSTPVPPGGPGASALDALDDDLFDFSDTRALRDDTARAAVEEVERELVLDAQKAKKSAPAVSDIPLPPLEKKIPAAKSVQAEAVDTTEEMLTLEDESEDLIDFGEDAPEIPAVKEPVAFLEEAEEELLVAEESEEEPVLEIVPEEGAELDIFGEPVITDEPLVTLEDTATEESTLPDIAIEEELTEEGEPFAIADEELIDFGEEAVALPSASQPVATLEEEEELTLPVEEEELPDEVALEEELSEEEMLEIEEEEELVDFGAEAVALPSASQPVAALEEEEFTLPVEKEEPLEEVALEEELSEEEMLEIEEEEELVDFGEEAIALPSASQPVAAIEEEFALPVEEEEPLEIAEEELADFAEEIALPSAGEPVAVLEEAEPTPPAIKEEPLKELSALDEPLAVEDEELVDFGADAGSLPEVAGHVSGFAEDEVGGIVLEQIPDKQEAPLEEDDYLADFGADSQELPSVGQQVALFSQNGDDGIILEESDDEPEAPDVATEELLDEDEPLAIEEDVNLPAEAADEAEEPLALTVQPAVPVRRKVVHDDSDLSFLPEGEDASALPEAELVNIHELFPPHIREVKAHCPSCQARYQLPEHYSARTKLRCAVCGERVSILPTGADFPRPESAADMMEQDGETSDTVRLRSGAGAAIAAAVAVEEMVEEEQAVQEDLAEQIDLFAGEDDDAMLAVEEDVLPAGEDSAGALEVDLGELDEVTDENEVAIDLDLSDDAEDVSIDPEPAPRSSHRPSRTKPDKEEARSDSADVDGAEENLFDFGNATGLANVITGSDSSVFTGISTDTTFKKKDKTDEKGEDGDEVVEW